jgi:hypothetical protein
MPDSAGSVRVEPVAGLSSLLHRRISLIAGCSQGILLLLGLGAIVSRLVKMSPLLPSYPGWSFTWTDGATIAIGSVLVLVSRGSRIRNFLLSCILEERSRTKLLLALSPLLLLLLIVAAKLTIGRTTSYRNMLDEGGFVEYLTAISLFAATLIAVLTGRRFWRRGERALAGISFLYGAFLFVFWGEEVSWGQRTVGWLMGELFAWQLPAFFVEYNVQQEFNFHNLVWIVPYMKVASALVGVIAFLLAVLGLWIARTGSQKRKAAARRVIRYAVPGWYLMPLFVFSALFLGLVAYCEDNCPHDRYFGVIIPADSEIGEAILAVSFLLFVLANFFRQAAALEPSGGGFRRGDPLFRP